LAATRLTRLVVIASDEHEDRTRTNSFTLAQGSAVVQAPPRFERKPA